MCSVYTKWPLCWKSVISSPLWYATRMTRRHRPILQAQLAARGLAPYGPVCENCVEKLGNPYIHGSPWIKQPSTTRLGNPQGCPPKSDSPSNWEQTVHQVVASYPSPSMNSATINHITDLAYQTVYPDAPFPIPQNWQNKPNCEAWVKAWNSVRHYVVRLVSGAVTGRRASRHPSLPPGLPPPPSPAPRTPEWSLPFEAIRR